MGALWTRVLGQGLVEVLLSRLAHDTRRPVLPDSTELAQSTGGLGNLRGYLSIRTMGAVRLAFLRLESPHGAGLTQEGLLVAYTVRYISLHSFVSLQDGV